MRTHLIRLAAVLLLLSTPWLASAADPATPPRYSLKQDQPDTSSHILRDAVTGPLPLDKPYGELTPEQQRVVKAVYEEMAPDDEPPYPLDGLGSIMRAMLAGQGRLYVNGRVSLVVDVDSRGEAQSVSVLSSPDPQLTRFAAGVLMRTKYKPARCGGAPCAMQYPFRASFTIR